MVSTQEPTQRSPSDIRILHLEDNPDDALLIQHKISKSFSCSYTLVESAEEFHSALNRGAFELVLSDYRLPGYDGDQALRDVRASSADIPFIMVTGELGEDRAIEALHRGAWDYVLKNNLRRLVPAIQRVLGERRNLLLRREAEAAIREREEIMRNMLSSLPAALYTVDVDGRITFYNEACTELWGRQPEVGIDRWCGSWRLYDRQGHRVTHGNSPLSLTVRRGVAVLPETMIVERPDGSRSEIIFHCEPLRNDRGSVVGAFTLLTPRSKSR